MRVRALHLLAVGVSLTIALTGCADDDPGLDEVGNGEEAAAETVTATGFAFQPDTLTVAAGTTVIFVNEDDVGHTATSGTGEADGTFGVDLPAGGDGEFTFDTAGSYAYFCAIHPTMTAQIVVE